MSLPIQYERELDDEIFRSGEVKGRVTTSMSILTDSLLMLNALEVYYQKPSSKAVAPGELAELRANLSAVKELLREIVMGRVGDGEKG
jgi:hypothetical protein